MLVLLATDNLLHIVQLQQQLQMISQSIMLNFDNHQVQAYHPGCCIVKEHAGANAVDPEHALQGQCAGKHT